MALLRPISMPLPHLRVRLVRRAMSAYFASLSSHDLRRTIDQAFTKFDTDGSGDRFVSLCHSGERESVLFNGTPSPSVTFAPSAFTTTTVL